MLEETPESLRGAIPVSQEFAVDKRRLENVKALIAAIPSLVEFNL